ncbi:hypothetical protein ZIOFF_040016 [Zingiber officinale]|uniref:Transmembrane protein n=1 Tax=Zingiber officinale TaxID=94328 RepID=A0A8J5G5M5_ZINOF|nr:hypothetical protein ZIOFF_040016 [Zingiber officinale]
MLPSHEAAFLSELPNLTTISFEEGYTQLFGDSNLMLHGDGRTVHLSLDQRIVPPLNCPPITWLEWWLLSMYASLLFCSTFLYLFERRRRRRRKKQKQSLLRRDGLYNGPRITLQWGCHKRLRRIKVRDKGSATKSSVRRGIASRNVRRIADQESPLHPPLYPLRRSESTESENHNSRSVSSSPDKDDRCYTTRGSAALVCEGENADERASAASLPRFFISLSNKEKEEDFMVMKGCKLPQRPKKRSKFVQKCILLVSPGAWLSDLSQERYVVREKKGSRKVEILSTFDQFAHLVPASHSHLMFFCFLFHNSHRRRGLKAMSMESYSE